MYNDKDVSAGPEIEPLTLEQVKLFLKIEQDDEDDLLTALISMAREHFEDYTSRKLNTQPITHYTNTIAPCGYIQLCRPLQSVGSVKTYNDSDTETLVDAGDYYVDVPRSQLVWRQMPSQPGRVANGLVIEYTSGYGDTPEDVPSGIIQAMKALIAHFYENREAFEEMPATVKVLLQPYRVIRV